MSSEFTLKKKLLEVAANWRWRDRKPSPEEAKELACALFRWADSQPET